MQRHFHNFLVIGLLFLSSITIANAETTPSVDDVFMQATVNPSAPYVKAEAIYILKLFYNRAIQRPSFTEPKATESTIFLLGREKTYRQMVDGKPYQVLEQRYAIVPNKSGVVQIKGPTLTGQIHRSNGNQYDYYQAKWENFSIAAKTLTLNIKPALSSVDPWLPAREFKLKSHWSASESELSVGQPITLTISMYSNGVMGEQLPDLSHWEIPDVQIYNDKAEVVTTSDSSHLLGQRTEKIAFLPQKPGKLTIPARHIRWMNTQTGHLETATIPSKTFTISGALTTSSDMPTSPKLVANQVETQPIAPWYDNLWLWTTLAMGLLCLITIAFYQQRLRQAITPVETETPKTGQTQAWKAVKKACLANLPTEINRTLLIAAKQEWSEAKITNLQDIATLLDNETLREQLTLLGQLLYKGKDVEWHGKEFFRILQQAKAQYMKKKAQRLSGMNEERLSKLYPE